MSRPECSRRRLLAAAGLALPVASLLRVGSPPSPPGVSWTREYGHVASFNDAAPAHGGGVVVVGSIREDGPASTRAWIVSVDDAGAVRWQRRLGPAGRTSFHSIVRTDDGYAVAGTRRPESEREPAGWLALLGGNGTLLTEATHRDQRLVTRTVIVAVEEGFVLAGAEPTAQTATTWIAGFDVDASERWSARYRRTYHLDALLRTPDGPVTVGTRVGQTDDAGDPWLAAFDADGREQWSAVVDVDGWYDVGAAVPTPDGGFILAGRSIVQSDAERIVIVRLDAERAVLRTRDLPVFEDGFPSTIERLDDGYLLAGVDAPNGIVAAMIDGQGSTRWSHVYGGTTDLELATTVDRGDGRSLLVGRVAGHPENDRRRGWAAALSPDANATALGAAARRGNWTPTASEPAGTTTSEPTSTTIGRESTITDPAVPSTTDGDDRTATATPGQSGFGIPAAIGAAAVAVGLARRRDRRFES